MQFQNLKNETGNYCISTRIQIQKSLKLKNKRNKRQEINLLAKLLNNHYRHCGLFPLQYNYYTTTMKGFAKYSFKVVCKKTVEFGCKFKIVNADLIII